MPIKDLFEAQIDDLRAFMEFPGLPLCSLRHSPDIHQPLLKVLVGLSEEEDSPHVVAFSDTPFSNPEQFFTDALKELSEDNEKHRSELAQEGITLATPQDGTQITPFVRYEQYVSSVADSFPDSIGSYVIILDPQRIDNRLKFNEAMLQLAEKTRSDWAKFIFLDQRDNPVLDDIEQRSERAVVQEFHFAPDKIEAQVNLDLERGRLSPPERRQYMAMAGAFAFAHGDLPKALKIQTETLALAEKDGSPSEQANALYNLGNTHLKAKNFAEAEACFARAAQLCLDQKQNALLAMVMANLGVTLHRLGRMDECLQSLAVSQRTFKALNNPPGEAYALDSMAAVLAVEKRPTEAEQKWLTALAIYDGITNPALAEVRQGGREDILAKLKVFYKSTRQTEKLRRLSAPPPSLS